MATKHRSSKIEDDWQEIDETHSVRSLSTTDDDSDSDLIDLGRSSPAVKPTAAPALAPPPAQLQSTPVPPTSTTVSDVKPQPPAAASDSPILKEAADFKCTHTQKPPKYDESESSTAFTLDQLDKLDPTEQSETLPIDKQESADNDSEASQSTVHNSRDSPVAYHNALRSVRKTLFDVIDETDYRVNNLVAFRIPIVYKIQDATRMILQHLQDLDPILDAYAMYWNSFRQVNQAGEIPLNASLLQWMNELSARLLKFQQDMEQQARSYGPTRQSVPTPGSLVVAFEETARELDRLQASMADFLPLIKLDYSEFQTKQMVFPDADASVTVSQKQRHPPRHSEVSRIRQELYSLKDQLQALSTLIGNVYDVLPEKLVPGDIKIALKALQGLVDAITTILTNHGSEWIESNFNAASRKVLPYAAFVALSPDILHDVTAHLGQIYEELDAASDPLIKLKITPLMVHNHQKKMLIEGGQLQEILSTTSFLDYLLMPESI